MQQVCETIYPAVIHNTVHGKDVKNAAEKTNSPYMGEVFGPPSQQKIGKTIMFFLLMFKEIYFIIGQWAETKIIYIKVQLMFLHELYKHTSNLTCSISVDQKIYIYELG